MKDYTLTEKYAIINILSAIMEADTIIHPKEIEYMNSVMENLQIVISDLDHLEMKDYSLDRLTIKNMSKDKQLEAMSLFQQMAEIDGYVDPREIDIINSII
jgi:uncharacterized tellurite resistance protein B-like protein